MLSDFITFICHWKGEGNASSHFLLAIFLLPQCWLSLSSSRFLLVILYFLHFFSTSLSTISIHPESVLSFLLFLLFCSFLTDSHLLVSKCIYRLSEHFLRMEGGTWRRRRKPGKTYWARLNRILPVTERVPSITWAQSIARLSLSHTKSHFLSPLRRSNLQWICALIKLILINTERRRRKIEKMAARRNSQSATNRRSKLNSIQCARR